jgi:predicted phosphodiesterase
MVKQNSLVSNLATIELENQRLKEQLNRLESILEITERQLSQARNSKIKLNIGNGKQPRSDRDTFVRVIIPDSHGSYIDEGAASALLADIKILNPSSIIMLGDHLDCGGFLAQHHTMGFVAECDYTFEDDCNATNQFLDQIAKAAPNARIEYLEGNHERRIEKFIVTSTLSKKSDSNFLRKFFSTQVVLNIEKRGIDFYSQGVFYDGLRIPATIRRDGCYFTHGEYTSKNAAAAHLAKYGSNVWNGHTHRADFATKRTVKDGLIGAWNPGCICRVQPLWMHTNLTDWGTGYGLQLVRKGVGHLNLPIPIIDNVSYLAPLVSMGGRRK